MVLLMGGPRVFFSLARDGLLPKSWSAVHKKFGTPHKTTIGTAVGVALVAGFGSLNFAGQITNIGTLFAFVLVCLGVIVLRYTKPDLPRPFKVPLNVGRFPILAALGAVLCATLAISLSTRTITIFFGWMGLGLVVYSIYGIARATCTATSAASRRRCARSTRRSRWKRSRRRGDLFSFTETVRSQGTRTTSNALRARRLQLREQRFDLLDVRAERLAALLGQGDELARPKLDDRVALRDVARALQRLQVRREVPAREARQLLQLREAEVLVRQQAHDDRDARRMVQRGVGRGAHPALR